MIFRIEYADQNVQIAINAAFVAERNAEAQQINNATAIAKAEAEAEAIKIAAAAEAEANQLLSASITDRLIDMKKAERWNGQLPKVTGGTTPIIDLGE